MGIKFDKDPLAVKNYLSKVVNVYIVSDLDGWPRNPPNNFKFKNCLFGSITVIKNSDKEKYVYSGYGITFDSAGSWSFNNDTARNIIFFGVDNSSSVHIDNCKNNFLVLGEGPTYGINGSFGSPEKKFSINFSKENIKFCLSLHYNFVLEVYLMELVLLSLALSGPQGFCLSKIFHLSIVLNQFLFSYQHLSRF